MAKLNMSKGSAYYVFLAQPSPAYGKLFFPISIAVLHVPINPQGQCWLLHVLIVADVEHYQWVIQFNDCFPDSTEHQKAVQKTVAHK